MKKKMNKGKGQYLINVLELKNATVKTIGNEECILIDCDEKYINELIKKGFRINGHFSNVGFVMCNLHNLM